MGQFRVITPCSQTGPPAMTTTQRDALTPEQASLIRVIWNSTTNKLQVWNGSGWQDVAVE